MKTTIVHRLLLLCLAASTIAAAQTARFEEFAVRLPLSAGSEGLHVLELTEPVYRGARTRTLADMRIFNARGEALPIAFLPAPPVKPATAAPIDLRFVPLPAAVEARDSLLRMYALRVERDRDRAVVEIIPAPQSPASPPTGPAVGAYLVDARSLKDLRGQLVLVLDANAPDYAGTIEIQGSEDLVSWRRVTSGPLTRNRKLGEVIERATFNLNRPPSFMRIGWASLEIPVLANMQFIEERESTVTLPRAILATTLSNDRRTLYAEVPEALPVEQVYIRMPEQNRILRANVYRHDVLERAHRRSPLSSRRTPESWQMIGSMEAFRVMRDGVEVEGAPLALKSGTDRLRFEFAEPLQGAEPSIEAQWRPHRVLFAALAPGPYSIAAGQKGIKAGPSLEARSLLAVNDPAGMQVAIATIGGSPLGLSELQPGRRASPDPWSRYLLWIVLAAAVLGLAWMAWRLSLQLKQQGSVEKEQEK